MVSVQCILCGHRFNAKPIRYYSEGYTPICGSCRMKTPPDEYRCTDTNSRGERCGQWACESLNGKQKCQHHGSGKK